MTWYAIEGTDHKGRKCLYVDGNGIYTGHGTGWVKYALHRRDKMNAQLQAAFRGLVARDASARIVKVTAGGKRELLQQG